MPRQAKKRGEKSAAIREFVSQNPSVKPKQIAEELNKQGFKVNPQYVSTILSMDRKKKKRRGRPSRAAGAPVKSAASEASFDHLLAAKRLIDKAGSVEAAKQALSQYSQLMA